jgi:hypothetical protein
MAKFLELLARILLGILNAKNRHDKRVLTDDAAAAIANNGRVQRVDKTFSDVAEQSKRDRTE